MVFWPFFGPKINSFRTDLKTTRPEPNRTARSPRENRQFYYKITKIRTRPPTRRTFLENAKVSISPALVGVVILNFVDAGFYSKMTDAHFSVPFITYFTTRK